MAGRILYQYDQGTWNEWRIVLDGGTDGWLSDAQNALAVSFLTSGLEIPTQTQAALGQSFVWNGTPFTVVSRTLAHYAGVEGELPFEYWDKADVTFVDLRSEGADFATHRLQRRGAGAVHRQGGGFRHVAAEQRPHVRGLVTVADGTRSPAGQCALRQLSELRGRDRRPHVRPRGQRRLPELPLDSRRRQSRRHHPAAVHRCGSRGAAHSPGHQRQAARHPRSRSSGFQVRQIVVDEVAYQWREYLLFNPYHGFRYLTEYARTLERRVDDASAAGGRSHAGRLGSASYGRQQYRHFQTADRDNDLRARGISVADSRRRHDDGQSTTSRRRIMLSAEVDADKEVTWSLGRYVSGDGDLDEPVVAGQAAGAGRRLRESAVTVSRRDTAAMWRNAALLIALAALLWIAHLASARGKQAFAQTLRVRPAGRRRTPRWSRRSSSSTAGRRPSQIETATEPRQPVDVRRLRADQRRDGTGVRSRARACPTTTASKAASRGPKGRRPTPWRCQACRRAATSCGSRPEGERTGIAGPVHGAGRARRADIAVVHGRAGADCGAADSGVVARVGVRASPMAGKRSRRERNHLRTKRMTMTQGCISCTDSIVVGLMGTAQYRGWRLTSFNEARTVPKSVRDNPGSYRPVYGGFWRFTGGK